MKAFGTSVLNFMVTFNTKAMETYFSQQLIIPRKKVKLFTDQFHFNEKFIRFEPFKYIDKGSLFFKVFLFNNSSKGNTFETSKIW